MNYTVKEIPRFYVAGLAMRTQNTDGQSGRDIDALIERFKIENITDQLTNRFNDDLYVVYADFEGDHEKPYTVLVGHRVEHLDVLHEGLSGMGVGEGRRYAVFQNKGHLNRIAIQNWDKVYSEKAFERLFLVDFDHYPASVMQNEEAEVFTCVGII